MKGKKKRLLSFAAIVFLIIIVLQYVENKMERGKMQRGKLSVYFSNHGPFIKQLDRNFIIKRGKKGML